MFASQNLSLEGMGKRIAMGEKMKQLFADTTSPAAGSQVVLSAQEEEEEAVVVSMRSLLVKNILA
jgi:hypothetical protein